ncbi:MAG: diacylglycerol/polyprenol kinase family protein [Acidobacteriota bacterium]
MSASLSFASAWVGIAAALTAFLVLFVVIAAYVRAGGNAEISRKLLHTGSGFLTLGFPFVFHDLWPVLLLTGASAVLIAAAKFVPVLRTRLGRVASGVQRTTLGELYFPIAVALLFWLTRGQHPLLYVIPLLVLTIADATCALVGRRYGTLPYSGASKSLEGSIAFAVVAFFCIHVPLLLWSDTGRVETLLMSSTLALLVMLLEGSAWRGLDNLFIPIGGYFLLRVYVTLDAPALLARLAVTVGLVAFIVFSRQRTTLEDDSLVAGAFLCYIAWAVMGWRWLVAPVVVFVGYAWLSPQTPDNARRMHGVPAVLSVFAGAIGWLVLAHVKSAPALLFPYTVVFAAHLAMFGVSRLAYQFPDRPLIGLFWRAVSESWLIVFLPFVASAGATIHNVAAAGVALAGVAFGSAAFVRTQSNIRHAPQTRRRWVWQACAACLASVTAWLLLTGLEQSML